MQFNTLTKRIFLVCISAPIVSCIVTVCGCDCDEEEDSFRRASCRNLCLRISRNPLFDEQTRLIAQNALEKWQNDTLDPEPHLLVAWYSEAKDGHWSLDLKFSDEDFDLSGLGVSEIHHAADGGEQVIEERYPIFETRPFTHSVRVRFKERTGNQRMDIEAWAIFVEAKGKCEYPWIWISLPKNKGRDVKVWLYDRKGHESNRLSLKKPYSQRKNN